MKNKIIAIFFYLLRVFPIINKKIVVSMYGGRGYGNEGKYICDTLLKMYPDVDIVWLNNKKNDIAPERIRYVYPRSFKGIYEQVTSHIWIDNRRKPGYVRKRKGQYYIHTWHGGGPCLKYIEKDAQDKLPEKYIKYAKADSKMADLMVSGSEWRTQNMQNSFWYDGEIMKCDIFKTEHSVNTQVIREVVNKYFGLNSDDNILLYAPTFRADWRFDCYDVDYDALIEMLKIKHGGKWKIIVRLHPSITHLYEKIAYSENILNGSNYPQIEDLIKCSEFLITDYSGCMFDGYKFGCKVLLYANDLEEYLENDRGMYFDIRQLPSPLSENMDELLHAIEDFDKQAYEKNRKEFVNQIGYYNDVGPEIICDRILKLIR